MSRRVKVLRVVIGLHLGGVQQGVLNLCRQVDRERYEVIVCALENDGAIGREIAREGFEVVVLGLKGTPDRWPLLAALYRLLRRRGIDIVHGSAYHPSLYGRVAGWLARAPILINHEHSLAHHRRRARVLMNSWLDRVTAAHIAVSREVARQAVAWYHLDPGKVEVIYNGVRPEFFQAAAHRSASRAALGISPETRVLGLVSRLDRNKGFADLFAALAGLPDDPPVRLLLVGSGPHEGEVKALAGSLGVADRVSFLGLRRDVPELLAAMDVFVLPSLQEGFANALIEAMAVGLPVVVSDVPGNLEAVVPGVSGIVVPRGNAGALRQGLQQVLDNPELARGLGAAARERVAAHFTVETYGRGIQALYDNLVRRHLDPGW